MRAVILALTIEAVQVDVSAKITARIVERAVAESQPVERGQLLVRLADAEPAAEVRRAEAAVRTAQAQLSDLEAGARSQEIEQARAALRNATVTREGAERGLARVRQLFTKEVVALQEGGRAGNAFDAALAHPTGARGERAPPATGPRPPAG